MNAIEKVDEIMETPRFLRKEFVVAKLKELHLAALVLLLPFVYIL
jgi:hypothetical protein